MKTYCLRCRMPGICKCNRKDMLFRYSDKLRVPTSIKNKVRFREFLDACPPFVNLVPEELQPAFIELLRDVKYFNKTINGRSWTNITET